jgi:hypothetical protein
VFVEHGVGWKAYERTVFLSQYDALCFFRRCNLKDFFHFLLGHPTGGAVCSGFAPCEVAAVEVFAFELVMEFDVEDDGNRRCKNDKGSLQAVIGKGKL